MNRGEIWWVNFEAGRGGEIKKARPAIIISNDAANRYLNRVQVVPITSNVSKLYPSESYVTIDGRQCKALADQLMTVSKSRLYKFAAHLSQLELKGVERVIKVQLGLK